MLFFLRALGERFLLLFTELESLNPLQSKSSQELHGKLRPSLKNSFLKKGTLKKGKESKKLLVFWGTGKARPKLLNGFFSALILGCFAGLSLTLTAVLLQRTKSF